MRPSNVRVLLESTIRANHPVLLVGSPGVGKSDLVALSAKAVGSELIISHPVVADPTDVKGLPWLSSDKDSATFLPFGDMLRAIKAKTLTTWFLDDLGQASPAVQASYMQLLLARQVNGHKLPDCVNMIAATNKRQAGMAVTGMLDPVKSRFTTIIEVEPDLDDFCQWAFSHNIQPELIAFLRFRPELLFQWIATQDMVNQPCPRTWANASKILGLALPAAIELEALSGSIGQGPAGELIAFLRVYRDLPSLDGILLDADKAMIPDSPSALYAVSVGLAAKATEKNFPRVARYAERLHTAGKSEFAVLMLRDSIRRNDGLCNTPDFIKLVSSDLGKLIQGKGV